MLVLKLLAVHFAVRFMVRPSAPPSPKPRRAAHRLAQALPNTALFLVLSAVAALPEIRSVPMSAWRLSALLTVIGAVRIVVDMAAAQVSTASWRGLLLAEAAHVIAVTSITSAFVPIPGISSYLLALWTSPRTYGLIAAYAVSLGLGSLLVPLVSRGVAPSIQETDAKDAPGTQGAGRCIGILERLLITTLIIYWPTLDAAAIGLIFGAKSIARFPEFRSQRFAEYYLIGTLTSFSVAVAAGLLARSYLPSR